MTILALLVATAIPLVFLYVIYALDLYRTGAFRYVLLCFVWGGIAFAAAYYINRWIYFQHWLSRDEIVRYGAPFVEEILKAAILLYLVRRADFTYFVDGAIFGFSAGIGFAIFENYQYIMDYQSAGFGVAISRVLSTNLIHAACSALVGVALGLSRFKSSYFRWLYLLAGWLLAMCFHSLYNNLVSRVVEGPVLLYGTVLGFGGAGLIAFAIFRGLAEEKVWIEEKLGEADRVTVGEAKVVHQLADVQNILAPLVERFGPEKAEQIERFLVIQAKLGIQRKTLEKLNDEKMRQAVEKQMADSRAEMDKARRAVGAYTMLYLRRIFIDETSPLWGRLETAIQERIAARPATGGTNLWATLGQRTAKPLDPPKAEPPSAPS